MIGFAYSAAICFLLVSSVVSVSLPLLLDYLIIVITFYLFDCQVVT